MPSTPDPLLRLELQATGENANTWGIKTNSNLELLSQAIAGAANVNVGGSGNYTLVASNYTTDEARAATLVLTGTLSGNRDVIVPSSPKHYTIINQTSGAFPLTIRQVSGTGVAIPTGSSQIVCTSTTCVGVGINAVSRTGDTMTGALGFAVGSSTTTGLFPAGDTNTGFFQAAAAPDTLSISVGGTEVARYGTGGFMRLAAGTAAAPAFSFVGDPDTGVFNPSANRLAVSLGGVLALDIVQTGAVLYGDAAQVFSGLYMQNLGASASNQRVMDFSALNESGIPGTSIYQKLVSDGSAQLELYATPAGARNTDRRVNRMTIPGSGAISMVGPVNVDGKALQIQRGTEQATTSGTAIDFTSIPAGVRRITVMFNGVSTNGSSILLVQLGTSGGVVSSGYTAGTTSGTTHSSSTAGFPVAVNQAAASEIRGIMTIQNISGNNWIVSGAVWNGIFVSNFGGSVGLAAVLDRIRLTATNGTDVFDAGAINIMWEF